MADLLKTLRQLDRNNAVLRQFEPDTGRPFPHASILCANCKKPTTVALLWCATCDRDELCLDCREPKRHKCHTPKPANWGE